jgi:hypothetical protein
VPGKLDADCCAALLLLMKRDASFVESVFVPLPDSENGGSTAKKVC